MEPNGRGLIVAVQPSTRNILKILLPMTLPSAMPVLPFSAAVTEVASSGSDVPAATMVRPITASLTPSPAAMPEAPATKRSPPYISPARPPMIQSVDFHTGMAVAVGLSTASLPVAPAEVACEKV